jgi:hypothetical protein
VAVTEPIFTKLALAQQLFLWSCAKCHENCADGLVADARSQEDGGRYISHMGLFLIHTKLQ